MPKSVDLIVFNGNIITVDEEFNLAESFAVKNGKFVEVSSNNDILRKYKSNHVVDANGKTILPGFFDSHCHFYYHGLNKYQYIDITNCSSVNDVINTLISSSHLYRDEWLVGRGWDQHKLKLNDFPNKSILDSVFPDRPVFLIRVDGHAAWVNSFALKLAQINHCQEVDGGKIICVNNEPTGILIDKAMDLVSRLIPPIDKSKIESAILDAQRECLSYGITTVVDAGLKVEDIKILDSLKNKVKLILRIYAMLLPFEKEAVELISKGPIIDESLTIRAIKLFADGAMGSRGACLLEPYSDDPTNYGILLMTKDSIKKYCKIAYDNGWQVATHVIGDSALRVVLQSYAEILPFKNNLRWRIEHVQLFHPDDLHLLGKYSIIPSVQTSHILTDINWVEKRLGLSRLSYAYAWQSLLQQNGWLCNGTDFPVESMNPLRTLYSSIRRVSCAELNATEFFPSERLTFEQAIRSMTIWGAKACFMEHQLGSIEVGKIADFVILEKNLQNVPLNEISSIKVNSTWIAGKKVFESK